MVAPVAEVSVTVTAHAEPWPTITGVAHVTVVVVAWTDGFTVTLAVPLLKL